MEREHQPRQKKKDRTGALISAGLHVLIIAIIAYFVSKTEFGQMILEKTIGTTRDKKVEDKPKPPPAQAIDKGRLKPPPGAPPPPRAPAAEAPPPVGEGFVTDTRKQETGPSSGEQKKTETKTIAPPPPPKPAMKAAGATSIKQLYAERAKEAAAVEAIGSEQISKSGSSDAGDVVSKVGGTVLVEGKFAAIRGLSDRYVMTTLNGAEVPSPDPYRKSVALDMFPAQMISKVVVAKTFTPDQPGSYTGGGINIITKSFPERPFMTLSIGGAYNTQATGNEDFLTYDGGDLDWLGMDDGTRELPEELEGEIPLPILSTGPRNGPNYDANVAQAQELHRLSLLMANQQFAPDRDAPPINQSFALAAGETTHFVGKPLGVFAGLNYKRDYNFYDDGISQTYFSDPTTGGELVKKSDYADVRSVIEVNWAAMASLSYQLHEHHVLNFNFLYNQNSEDVTRVQTGSTIDDDQVTYQRNRLHWTERNLQTFQLKGSHLFPEVGNVKLDWLGALSNTSQDEPGVAFFNLAQDIVDTNRFEVGRAGAPEPRLPTVFYRNLEEENQNVKADLTLPFWQWTMDDAAMKLGVWSSTSERDYLDREIFYDYGSANPPATGDPNEYPDPDNFGYIEVPIPPRFGGGSSYRWKRFIGSHESAYNGDYTVRAGYWMIDTPLVSNLRVVGGVRMETTDISIFSRSYLASGITGERTNTTDLSEAKLLPAASLVWGITSNMNARFSFSQTLARPSFRELAAVRTYDPILDELIEGNPRLQLVDSENYDLRWEWFFRPGEVVSVSVFYKDLQNAIEKIFITTTGDVISFVNRPEATVWGAEFELRKNLGFLSPRLELFSLGANFTYIESETEWSDDEFEVKKAQVADAEKERPLFDQSPYIVNVDLSYDNPRSGTSASLVFNMAGPRISITSLTSPDVYDQPAPTLDFILSQRLGKHLAIKFSAKNLLNPDIKRSYGEDEEAPRSSYTKGVTFGVGLSYDF